MGGKNEQFKTDFKKRLYRYTLNLVKHIDSLPGDVVSRRMGDQLLRSGTSIIANYVEGQSGSSRKDFANYMQISLKSANECRLWLSLLKDSGRANPARSDALLQEAGEIANIFGSIVLTVKGKKIP